MLVQEVRCIRCSAQFLPCDMQWAQATLMMPMFMCLHAHNIHDWSTDLCRQCCREQNYLSAVLQQNGGVHNRTLTCTTRMLDAMALSTCQIATREWCIGSVLWSHAAKTPTSGFCRSSPVPLTVQPLTPFSQGNHCLYCRASAYQGAAVLEHAHMQRGSQCRAADNAFSCAKDRAEPCCC